MDAAARLFAVRRNGSEVAERGEGGEEEEAEVSEITALAAAVRRAAHLAKDYVWHGGRAGPLNWHLCCSDVTPTSSRAREILDDAGVERVVEEGGSQRRGCPVVLRHLHAEIEGALECVDDEWMLAACVRAATSPEDGATPDWAIAGWLADTDGAFMLVEAAESLPSWAEDGAATAGRVWLVDGRVHLVPLPRTPAELMAFPPPLAPADSELDERVDDMFSPTRPPVRDDLAPVEGELLARVLRLVCGPGAAGLSTEASSPIQECLETRFGPAAVDRIRASNFHRARCLLPETAARLLRELPECVPLAVRALSEHEVDMSVRGAGAPGDVPRQLSTSLCSPREGAGVASLIRFSRMTFAMIESQHLADLIGFLPPRDSRDAPFLRGMRLTAGLELWLADSRAHPTKDAARAILAAASSSRSAVHDDAGDEDSAAWMQVSPEEVDALLAERAGAPLGPESAAAAPDAQDLPPRGIDDMFQDVQAFMNHSSPATGVETQSAGFSFDADEVLDVLAGKFGEVYKQPSKARVTSVEGKQVDREFSEHAGRPAAAQGVDIDVDVVSNLVNSFASQHGLPGPLSNILGEFRTSKKAQSGSEET
jgi:SGT1 protein